MYMVVLVFVIFVAALMTNLTQSHTIEYCHFVNDTTVTFYGGTYHSYTTTPSGGIVLSGGPSGNGIYSFTETLTNTDDSPTGVDLSQFSCVTCSSSFGISYWQKVVITFVSTSISVGTYDVTTTTSNIEAANCDFGTVTLDFTPVPTPSPTPAPTPVPTLPTRTPSAVPTTSPTLSPSVAPSEYPSAFPTAAPTLPSTSPSAAPTVFSLTIYNSSTSLECYGYTSCINSAISVIGSADTECHGSYSCSESILHLLGNGAIDCFGFQSCSKTILFRFMSGDIIVYGASGLVNSNVTLANGDLYCYGDKSCADSYIADGGRHYMYGHLSGQNSVFEIFNNNNNNNNSDAYFYFYGERSGQDAIIVCGDNCTVYCYGNGCHGLNLTCDNYNSTDTCAFTIYCVGTEYDDHICSDGDDLSSFMGDVYLPDTSNISNIYNDYDTGLQDCENANTHLCDEYHTCAGQVLTNASVCCSAAQGCRSAVSIEIGENFINNNNIYNNESNNFVRCDGNDACSNIKNGIKSSLNANSMIHMSTYNPNSHINNSDHNIYIDAGGDGDIICSGYSSCVGSALIAASNLYCNGYKSCISAFVNNISTVYAYGYYSASETNIFNTNNVYCASYGCNKVTINNVYDSVYCHDYRCLCEATITNAENVFIFGYEAAISTNIANVNQLYCDGIGACQSSLITNVSIIEVNGTDVLAGARINSGGNGIKMFVTLHGDVSISSNNTWIICQIDDICVIDCNEFKNNTDANVNVCNDINFQCDGFCVFKPTSAPTTIPTVPTYIPTNNPTSPSVSPSSAPSGSPTYSPSDVPTDSPSALPSVAPSLYPSSSPTIDYYFHSFNHSDILDVLFGSTSLKHNATNLNKNEILQNEVIIQLESSSYSAITNQKNRVLETKIQKIWTYNTNINTSESDRCQLKNISGDTVNIYKPIESIYSSWIRFEVKFKSQDIKDDWDTHLQTVVRLFRNDLTRNIYFSNDTISVYYCQLKNISSTSSPDENNDGSTSNTKRNDDLVAFSLIVTIVVLSFFILISLFGLIDSMLRRNEIFSIFYVMPASTYFLDIVSGLSK